MLIAQRWILACLRNRRFHNLDELNEAIAVLLERLNTRPFLKLEGCRRSVFEMLERPAMRPLPVTRYPLATWRTARVNIDYHVEYDSPIHYTDHRAPAQDPRPNPSLRSDAPKWSGTPAQIPAERVSKSSEIRRGGRSPGRAGAVAVVRRAWG